MNTQNYLAASDLAYKDLRTDTKVTGIDGNKYEIVDTLHTKSGYDGYILYRADTKELIVAHRGTLPEKGARTIDVLTDVKMAIGQVNNQYPDAKRLTEMAIRHSQENPKYKGATIRQTGHSLGGALAQLCGYNYGHQTETFNAYGAGNLKERQAGKQNNTVLITNHVRGTDPVSAASPHLGRVEIYLNRTEQMMLYGGGYGKGLNSLNPNSPWKVAVGGAVMDHGLDNFQNGGLSALDRQFAVKNKELIHEFRSEFEKEVRGITKPANYIQEKIDEVRHWSNSVLHISGNANTAEHQLAGIIAHNHDAMSLYQQTPSYAKASDNPASSIHSNQDMMVALDKIDLTDINQLLSLSKQVSSMQESQDDMRLAKQYYQEEQEKQVALESIQVQEQQSRGFSMGRG